MKNFRVPLFLGLLLAPAPALAQGLESIDLGTFSITVNGRPYGTEQLVMEARGDSIYCKSEAHHSMVSDEGLAEMTKTMVITFGRSDWGLHYYLSNETFRGQTQTHSVVANPADTALTLVHETKDRGGQAIRYAAPPGRLFVLDPGLFALFDVMCVYLHGKEFETRPLNLVTFGERDSIIEAQVRNLGTETIRWAARPIQARKYRIGDGSVTFDVWVNPAGKMLRLSHDPSGLRVERQPPAVKKPAPKPTPGG